jgi:alkanesulfonate monooxygenase SsuD/methylene tetrahydromethanopterin reductase-like flavin-dependent oxidoreductase (luciferase family)
VDISIGLPNTLSHPGPLMVGWARRAEERGFTSLSTIDRIVYPNYDTMTSLSVAAGATSRIRLLSGVLLAPLYPPVWLAKAAASLDAMSGGRLTLGLGVGGRADDFAAMGVSMAERGRAADRALDVMRTVFAGEKLPGHAFPVAPAGSPKLLIGGNSDAAVRRTVESADGWTAGGTPPEYTAPMLDKVRAAWRDAGREGAPRFMALNYFALGDVGDRSRAYVQDYYAPMGQDAVEMISGGVHRTADAIRAARDGFAEIGVDEFVLVPTVADLAQVDLLAEAVR